MARMEVDPGYGLLIIIFWLFGTYATDVIPKIISLVLCVFVRENDQSRSLRQKIRTLVSELSEISAVNEFAKHARKTRELLRLQTQLKSASATESTHVFKLSVFLNAVLYGSLLFSSAYVIWAFYGVPLLTLRSTWFYPLNYLMAFPDLAVVDEKSPVSCIFTLFLVWYSCRLSKLAAGSAELYDSLQSLLSMCR